MIGGFFKPPRRKTFNYVPRHYQKDMQNTLMKTMGDGKFVKNYYQKKMKREGVEQSSSIDLTGFRNQSRVTSRKIPSQSFMLLILLCLILFCIWVLTNDDFSMLFGDA